MLSKKEKLSKGLVKGTKIFLKKKKYSIKSKTRVS